MGLKHILLAAALTVMGFSSASVTAGPVLEQAAWPVQAGCERCVLLQFGELKLRLPPERLGRVFIAEGMHGLNVFERNSDPTISFLVGAVERKDFLEKYVAAGLLRPDEFPDAEAYFDKLGLPAEDGDRFAKLRRIEGVDRAKRYAKASRGPLHAYIFQTNPPVTEQVYIIIDGEPRAYRLLGRISPEMLQAVLANMRLVAIP